jgi:glycosyl transferase family 25
MGHVFQMQDDEYLQGVQEHVPRVDLMFDGDCTQATGVELPIAVINLAHRTDRWQAISSRMTAVGLNRLIKVPAIEGARLSPHQISALLHAPAKSIGQAPRSHLTLTPPAIGCFLSHLAIWRWTIANDLPRVLVFEDDATPAADFDAGRFRTAMSSLRGADLVFVGRIVMNGLADRPTAGATLARLYYFNGTFAYMITPAACRTLIRAIGRPDRHIDHQISKVLIDQRAAFSAYYTVPHFFEPDWSLRSDCYVPIEGETEADRELGQLLDSNRRLLLSEGRPLLPAS